MKKAYRRSISKEDMLDKESRDAAKGIPPDPRLSKIDKLWDKRSPCAILTDTEFGPYLETSTTRGASEIASAEVSWLWTGRIPLGKVTLLAGLADAGKSFVAIDLAARLSRGEDFPDDTGTGQSPGSRKPGTQKAGKILYVSTIADARETIRARLDFAQARTDNIHVLTGVTTNGRAPHQCGHRDFAFPDDFERVEHALGNIPDARLVIIDALTDFCASRSQQTKTLAHLSDLAATRGVAIVVLMRARGRCDAQARFQGTLDGANSPVRSAWGIIEDPDDPERKYFLPARMNYARPQGLAFRIDEGRVKWEPLGIVPAARVALERKMVRDWLYDLLLSGPQPSALVEKQAKEGGFTPAMVRTARRDLMVQPHRVGGIAEKGHWMLTLPGHPAEGPLVAPASAGEFVVPPSGGERPVTSIVDNPPEGGTKSADDSELELPSHQGESCDPVPGAVESPSASDGSAINAGDDSADTLEQANPLEVHPGIEAHAEPVPCTAAEAARMRKKARRLARHERRKLRRSMGRRPEVELPERCAS
jgi:putative DNA primase/helicase